MVLALTICSLIPGHLQGPINDAASQRRNHTSVESDYSFTFIHHLDALSICLIAHQVVLRLHFRLDSVEGVPNEAVSRPEEEACNQREEAFPIPFNSFFVMNCHFIKII